MSDHQKTPYINAGPYGCSNDKEVQITVLRSNAEFTIYAAFERLKNTCLGEDLQKQTELCRGYTFGQYGSLQTPTNILFQHCRPILERLVPQTELQDLSLESLLHAPTYHLELVAQNIGGEVDVIGQEGCVFKPAFFVAPEPVAQLASLLRNVYLSQASEVQIAPIRMKRSLTSVQGRVSTKDGRILYFKPRMELRESEFKREIHILLQIAEADLDPNIRIPRLEGFVVSGDNDDIVMGILMTWIGSPDMGCHLMSKGFWNKEELHKKWETQVTATVWELHAHGIVWGDVNLMNVVIDENLDAWVIDFGGMNNIDFIDDENRETVKGDRQGVENLLKYWLPSRAGKVK